jgi:hypothetical protein
MMMSPDENTPTGAAGKNGKAKPPAKKTAKKPAKKNAKQSRESSQEEPVQQAAPETEQVEKPQEPIAAVTVAMENPFTDVAPDAAATAPPTEPASSEPVEAAPSEPTEAAPSEPTEAALVSLQTITNAYGDFTRKSIEQTGSFFEQLAGVRSLNRAFELQGAFAQQTYETFVSESRKIRELHSELTMQRLRNLEGLVARMKLTRSG